MFSRKSTQAQGEVYNTVIGKGVLLEAARMTGNASIHIDGDYRGEIDIDANLVLGDSSVVTGNIHARYIVVAGQVYGNIRCDTVLHFASTAQVIGDIVTQSLIMDEGSQVHGQYSVGTPPQRTVSDAPSYDLSYLNTDEEA